MTSRQQKLFLNNLFNGVITIGGDGTAAPAAQHFRRRHQWHSIGHDQLLSLTSPTPAPFWSWEPIRARVMAGVLTAQTP